MSVGGRDVTAIVLAAGGGARMKSDVPKVLHPVAGRPVLVHVLAALAPLQLERRVIVSSKRKDEVVAAIDGSPFSEGLIYAVQDPPRGTGDAVQAALRAARFNDGLVLVVPGDTPLLETETLDALLHIHVAGDAAATALTARISDPTGYGRIVRDADHEVERIVEDRDASYEERAIDEINAGVYVFETEPLSQVLEKIDRENVQGEYYLTDVVALLRSAGHRVIGHRTHPQEVLGVNSRAQLARVGEMLRRRSCERWMDRGVTIVDPATTYIDASVRIGRDATIHPFTFLEGDTSVEERAEVGPQTRIVDTTIGQQARVSFAVVIGSHVGPEATVGPFASLRPGTRLERGSSVGTFVETKNAHIGEGSKANHLAYLGDAEVGRGVNVGAGSITCNWDGQDKHRTIIDDDAYVGSDTMLVAPVHLGKRSATGAGSVVREDVPDDALAVGAPARILEGKGNKMGVDENRADEEPRE
ncbi:MAG: bifunctional UDP-N-acetylglucosamine diphosphorylase/glucosamine-1-phosphate N-acetyltransferase GlmU [Actinomycetota bacterium]|nr:bifunctional UDP-N-acetylglucosamine diphosphorylase/glucosamine-1-phosphate N-acetyltransferase GlmU [Actinomycetota bacterium]